jgi:hypothetical protein
VSDQLAELMDRAESLSAAREEMRGELEDVLAGIAQLSSGDSEARKDWLVQFAARMQEERDEARRELVALQAKVAAADIGDEAKLRALEAGSHVLRAVCGDILNTPLMPREQVQSRLLMATQRFDATVGG